MINNPYYIDAAGWLHGEACNHYVSPNFDSRPVNKQDEPLIDLLVIHCISLPPGDYNNNNVIKFFTNQLDINEHYYYQEIAHLKVAAHLFITRDGKIAQFVSFSQRAWHCGISEWKGRSNCNDFSIGIELEGTDDSFFTDMQYQVLEQVTRCIRSHNQAITPDRIVGHSDIAPQRKTDPGKYFDWSYYIRSIQ